MPRKTKLERFNDSVLSKYQIYNSIFSTLPFAGIDQTGAMLPLFSELVEKGFEESHTPQEIVEQYFSKFHGEVDQKFKNDLLFRFIQFIERQVVLFDAVEDAAFAEVNPMDGQGTVQNVSDLAKQRNKTSELADFIDHFKIRTVLTAHPTQFYPGRVLGIITDLTQAIKANDISLIKKLLAQLGKTPFYNKQQPTPFQEAVILIWYLENIFYYAASSIYRDLQTDDDFDEDSKNQLIQLGFWPGGDRDGNPYVNSETTLAVAERLRASLLRNYYRDFRLLKRRITFANLADITLALENELYKYSYQGEKPGGFQAEDFLDGLKTIKQILIEDHQSLFVEDVQVLINKVKIFGFYFASLDIRQDSRIHGKVIEELIAETKKQGLKIFPENYSELSQSEKINFLAKVEGSLAVKDIKDELAKDTVGSIAAMQQIQRNNGELGSNRYIISNTRSALNVIEVLGLARITGWTNPTIDIIPLFETVDDLKAADQIMEELYTNPEYQIHLESRGNQQTIMLGFSDGTKDGGYLMANWSIYNAKEKLTTLSRNYGVKVVFFDGRGGPPARGGGQTHQFYASQGPSIENREIQLTVQGQTISSKFGTLDSCQYNLEQLLSAGIVSELFSSDQNTLSLEDRETLNELADLSYQAYQEFKNHPKFISYLAELSPLKYYAKSNTSSRPAKRGGGTEIVFEDLRAIPFVGSWSQIKQNVPGFYGVGRAIEHFYAKGEYERVASLFDNSRFFRTLMENTMMSLTKSFFPLTEYLKDDPEFGEFWQLIYDEYELTRAHVLDLFEYDTLMENTKALRASIDVREKIVLPLVTIQQYALKQLRDLDDSDSTTDEESAIYEKMIIRTLFGNINASRNSA